MALQSQLFRGDRWSAAVSDPGTSSGSSGPHVGKIQRALGSRWRGHRSRFGLRSACRRGQGSSGTAILLSGPDRNIVARAVAALVPRCS